MIKKVRSSYNDKKSSSHKKNDMVIPGLLFKFNNIRPQAFSTLSFLTSEFSLYSYKVTATAPDFTWYH
jgi:hypothetical protein